jgi:UDP-N-acetylglucosamine 2-epimerase (hydrolysing)
MDKKKIVFLTGTRADFGKLKSLISITQNSENHDVHIFVTGMHMNSLYGSTAIEIKKHGFQNIYQFINHDSVENMDRTLAKTVDGFSHYIAQIRPDLIVVHGDRVEALSGAIVGSLNNILVAHIEGGEISGTIDELIRHSISKMSHIHLVTNKEAKDRLLQLGELEKSIYILGSPDLDLMNPKLLPAVSTVKEYYGVNFDNYAIAMFHSVTTEFEQIEKHARKFVDALIDSKKNYIVIYPNNDPGSLEILYQYRRLKDNPKFKIFPSLRFEYFLAFLKESDFIIGNSSSGIREAPYYGVPTIDIGSRQNNRVKLKSVFSIDYQNILEVIENIERHTFDESEEHYFGNGDSDQLFLKLLNSKSIWNVKHQKQFQDLNK